jgi:predicted translin family RNA/ssDNA-binding protein
MIDKTYLNKLKKELHSYALIRRDIIKHAGDAQHHAKRAIFALHADNMKEAKAKLAESKKGLTSLRKKYKKTPRAEKEGSFREGLEEYVEAVLFMQFVEGKKFGKIDIEVPYDVYLAGLCDVPGELYRYAIKAATNGDTALAQRCNSAAQGMIGELIEFHFTKYLRTKFDQAKGAVRKLEIIIYELSLKK